MNNSSSPLPRPTGTQPTVIDQEVDLAAERQRLAPSAAAPPLLVNSMRVGAPVPNNGVHLRESPVVKNVPSYPEADAFARDETQRRLQIGGFYDTPHGTEILYAVPNAGPKAYLGKSEWEPLLPQVPVGLRTELHASGLTFDRDNSAAAAAPTANSSQRQPAGNAGARVVNGMGGGGSGGAGNKIPAMSAANMLSRNSQITNAAYPNGNSPVLAANGNGNGNKYVFADRAPLGANIFGNASPVPFNAASTIPTNASVQPGAGSSLPNGNGFAISPGNKSYISSFLSNADVGAAPVLAYSPNNNNAPALASNVAFNAGNSVNARRNANMNVIAKSVAANEANVVMAGANDAAMSRANGNSLAVAGLNSLQNRGAASANANGLSMTTNTASFNVANARAANMAPLNSQNAANMQQNTHNGANSRMYGANAV